MNSLQASDNLDTQIPASVIKILRDHFIDLGADRTLPISPEDRLAYYQRFYQALVFDNKAFPRDLPALFVLIRFLHYCVNNRSELKGFSISNHIDLFKRWLDIDSLRRSYYMMYPKQKPKALPRQNPIPDDERKLRIQEALQALASKWGMSIEELYDSFKISNQWR